jgi:hypothetical protein
VQRELVTVSAERCNNEVHLVLDEPRNEVHVARQTVESRDNQWATCGPRLLKGCGKAWTQQQRIRSCTSLHILVPELDREPFARSKGFDLVALRRKSKTTAALLLSADPQVTDCCLHREVLRWVACHNASHP